MQAEAENPMAINISPEVILNGKTLTCSHGCGLSWNPCFPEYNGIESKGVLEQYGLDPACGWTIWRSAFPWTTTRKPQITALSVILKQNLVAISGSHFHVSSPGECIEFIHPTTGIQHTLTVQEYEQQEIPAERFGDKNYEYPTHYTAMSYTLSPDLPDNSFTVTDCEDGDRPRKKLVVPNEPQSSGDCIAISIIGGAQSGTAIIFGGNEQGKPHVVCSALHFTPVDNVEWKMVFHEKTYADITVELM